MLSWKTCATGDHARLSSTASGHGEKTGQPTYLMAMNLNRQVLVIELPGDDLTRARMIARPYLFRADEVLTPVLMGLRRYGRR